MGMPWSVSPPMASLGAGEVDMRDEVVLKEGREGRRRARRGARGGTVGASGVELVVKVDARAGGGWEEEKERS